MRYLSTRGGTLPEPFGVALAAGIAPDGGLFVPEALPLFRTDAFSGREPLPTLAVGSARAVLRRRCADGHAARDLCGVARHSASPVRALAQRDAG